MSCLIIKIQIKGEKHIAVMGFAEYLKKSDVTENSKVYYGRFRGNGLHLKILLYRQK